MVDALASISTFEVDNIPLEALMFQAGYLTIDKVQTYPGRMQFTLKYPNLEVQTALNNSLLLTGRSFCLNSRWSK